ncbi:hypothetical protein GCM10009819_25360 [Agromyces tropicus]|uniref:Uncharacterized protein n=1 Tax=Agromyces tropicus TaxID=555371 RepID=A0ABN2UM77_9MICO
MEADEGAKRGCGVGGLLDRPPAALEQAAARVGEDRREHGGLAGEVPVDGGAGDAGGLPELLERDACVPVLGEEPRRRVEQRGAAVGLGAASLGERLAQGAPPGAFGE